MRSTGQQRLGGVTGKGFMPGQSGNPGGRPKGSRTYAVRALVAEAIDDPDTRQRAIEQLRENFRGRKTVVPALEFAARVNREIGLGSDHATAGVTIYFYSNLDPAKLRRPASDPAAEAAVTTPRRRRARQER